MSLKEWLSKLKILNPSDVKITSAYIDTIDLIIKGKVYSNVVPKKPFPYTRPYYIIFYTLDGKELGILRDYRKLDKESKKLLEKVLDTLYFIPKIKKVISIKFVQGKYRWVVDTDKGRIEFETWSSCSKMLSNGKIIIKDVHGRVYCIENLFSLDAKSISLISVFI